MRISCFAWMVLAGGIDVDAFIHQGSNCISSGSKFLSYHSLLKVSPGADIEQVVEEEDSPVSTAPVLDATAPGLLPNNSRGKVNEIDFCIAPADVSLSRCYSAAAAAASGTLETDRSPRPVSLTRYLNNASNRAVRRILLSRSWPSAEALNMSLRLAVAADKLNQQRKEQAAAPQEEKEGDNSDSPPSSKCPVPRAVLNVLVKGGASREIGGESGTGTSVRRSRTDEEYVSDQLNAFQAKYGSSPGYVQSEAYLECILSLATSGEESQRVSEILEAGIYDESYRRVLSVLKSVGTLFEDIPESNVPRKRVGSKVVDQDICLSMMDKIAIQQGKAQMPLTEIIHDNKEEGEDAPVGEDAVVTKDDETKSETEIILRETKKEEQKNKSLSRLRFWKKKENITEEEKVAEEGLSQLLDDSDVVDSVEEEQEEEEIYITPGDLGAVLLSAEEPSITRQLNVLSNIVERALLFGGDQELLVLSATLDADKPAFIQRWYPGTELNTDDSLLKEETRPGVQYLNCLILLLKTCYDAGEVTSLEPPLPLIQSYDTAYDRLLASLVELGSGYVKLMSGSQKLPVPRNAQEELGRFAVWESSFRKGTATPDVSYYPEDLEGSWVVKDEIGGETIGTSTVMLKPNGDVGVASPLRGLRWRLDPGPTHLDTCTFQVANEDGTILQYRGFTDRGARLESRFSKRAITVRGSVTFQMRDGEGSIGEDYFKDIIPVTGTTKFVMTKELEGN